MLSLREMVYTSNNHGSTTRACTDMTLPAFAVNDSDGGLRTVVFMGGSLDHSAGWIDSELDTNEELEKSEEMQTVRRRLEVVA